MSVYFGFGRQKSPFHGCLTYRSILASSKINYGALEMLEIMGQHTWIVCPRYQTGSQWNGGDDVEVGFGGSVLVSDSSRRAAAFRELGQEARALPDTEEQLISRNNQSTVFTCSVSSLRTIPNWTKSDKKTEAPRHPSKTKVSVLVHGSYDECLEFLAVHTASSSCQDLNSDQQDDDIMGLTMIPVWLACFILTELVNRPMTRAGKRDTRFAETDVRTGDVNAFIYRRKDQSSGEWITSRSVPRSVSGYTSMYVPRSTRPHFQ